MYIDNEDFEKWMAKLSKKLTEIGQDLKSLINTDKVLDDNEKILDNQDLAFLLKVSFRTLQRYRVSGQLPYFTIGKKTYYRAMIFGLLFVNVPTLKATNNLKKLINLRISLESKR